jgi:DNA-directed RNA polymerase subunit RPC12/RpoP
MKTLSQHNAAENQERKRRLAEYFDFTVAEGIACDHCGTEMLSRKFYVKLDTDSIQVKCPKCGAEGEKLT